MDLVTAKSKFLQFMGDVKPDALSGFLRWIRESEQFKCKDSSDIILENIANELREIVPFEAVLPSECTSLPTLGKNSDCVGEATIHVDNFLYTDDYLDDMVEAGKFSRNFCNECGSRDTKPLTFISHSASHNMVKFIFKEVLPDLTNKTVLDIGSRLGPVLYAAHLFSSCQRIVGVEMNKDLCAIQKSIIDKYAFGDRVSVVLADIMDCIDLLQSADVVIMNNVFEFFANSSNVSRLWKFVAENLKGPNKLLVTIPSLEDSLQPLALSHLLDGWVDEIAINHNHEDEDLNEVHLYKLL